MSFNPSFEELFKARREEAGLPDDTALYGRFWRVIGGVSVSWLPKNFSIEPLLRQEALVPALYDFGKLHDDSMEIYIAKVTLNTDVLSVQIVPEVLCEIISTVVTPIPLSAMASESVPHRRDFTGDVIQ